MKNTEIRLKVKMLNSLEDLIGKTITEVDGNSDYNIIICGDEAVLTVLEEDYSNARDGYGAKHYLEVKTNPIYEIGVEMSHALGLLNEEDYQQYKIIKDAEDLKRAKEDKLKKEAKEKLEAKNKIASDYKQYLELKEQFKEN